MPDSVQTTIAIIQATLAHDYGLEASEVDILTEDVLENLEAIRQILVEDGPESHRFADALKALGDMAANLRQARLATIATTLEKHRETPGGRAFVRAGNELNHLVGELRETVESLIRKKRRDLGGGHGARSPKQNHDASRGR
jgi:HPt (histidine-containing phosphotransfer) domain-containing protein